MGERTDRRRRRTWGRLGALACVLLVLIGGVLTGGVAFARLDRNRYGAILARLDQAMRSGADEAAAAALVELAEDDSARAVKVLAKVVRAMPESGAIHEAVGRFVGALADARALKEVRKLVRRGKPWQLRLMLVEALGAARGGEEVELLAKACGDRARPVAVAAVQQLGRVRTIAATEALIEAMQAREDQKKRDVVWQDMRNVLAEVLGTRLDAAIDYRNYLRARTEQFVEGKGLPPAPQETASGGEIGSVTLFGEPILCDKVVLILDVSGSMVIADPYPPGERRGSSSAARDGGDDEFDYVKDPERKRIFRAKRELIQTLEGLAAKGAMANVIAYSSEVCMWKPEGVHKLTKDNLESARKFVQSFVAEGVTATDSALMYAFERCPDADCFYLISDGFATHDGETKVPTEQILEEVREANRLLKIQINTLGFHPNPHVENDGADRELMTALARETGGSYTEIR